MKKKSYAKTKGFSIMEVLLAIFVLLIGVLGAVELTRNNLQRTIETRAIIVASGLAQEGIELVRNARDNNAAQRYLDKKNGVLTEPQWRDVFAGFSVSPCNIDYAHFYDDSGGLDCASNAGNLEHQGDGFYYSVNTSQKFKRDILLTDNADGSYRVISMVAWGESGLQTIPNCSLSNDCLYVENTLTSWIAVE